MFARLGDLFRVAVTHQLARNASWLLSGQLITFGLQVLYFVQLAKLLNVRDYGLLSGAFAVSFALMPYASLGGGMVYMRHVAKDRSLAQTYWGTYLSVTVIISLVFAGAASAYGMLYPHENYEAALILCSILANCLFGSVVTLATYVFQAQEKMRATAEITVSFNAIRLVLLIFFRFTFHTTSALGWSIGAVLAGGIASVLAIFLVNSEIGYPKFSATLLKSRFAEGAGFSFAGTTQGIYNDFDKILLTRYGMLIENGFYSLAYRAVDFASTPIASLDLSVIPRYMALGESRISEVVQLCRKTLLTSVTLGLVTALAILAARPLIATVFGEQYSGALEALSWLCWIPMLRGVHRCTGSALTGTGRQTFRTAAQFVVAGANAGANVLLIPKFGWKAACWTSVASDACLGLFNSIILFRVWAGEGVNIENSNLKNEVHVER